MEVFDAGVLRAAGGGGGERLVFRTTVHGPVVGYATVGGRRVAVSQQRSTRGREILSALFFADMNLNRPTSAQSFLRVASQMEMTFNWLYADDRDIAQFTSGRLPVRSPDVDPGLPRWGTGDQEWSGFAPFATHARVVNPPAGAIVNWNNRPALGFAASDDDWSQGSVQRVELLRRGIEARRRHTLATVVGAMNRAATQDLRAIEVWNHLRNALGPCDGHSARACAAVGLVDAWLNAGASRIDADLDGRIDHAGAAVLDAAWPGLADAVLRPVLGDLVDRLALLEGRHNRPANGNAFGSGWYGHVEKDLRAVFGASVSNQLATRFCGAGDRSACRASLWVAMEAAAAELAAAQGPDPAAWRADATRERTSFGFLPRTMRFANRPTFQQVISFSSHRPRR
jgi:acyl-homoserine lactone acylase PvdQ